ncbi:MAG TPA: HAMP domain-containing sensor histidine kinase [Burkholderiaceae bacterium]|nr:HAMP domain-containing sensor histidine kinase [Burkholderiaceae bacterium]
MNVLPRLEMPRLGLASFRRRILVRGVFVLLVLATLALAVVLLKEEKERSYRNYAQGFRKTQAEVAARLRHPAGQLALLNPARSPQATPLRPLLLPYSALDFDDQYKAQQAVEIAGCNVQYPGGGAICVAVGNNPYAGGFIYLVGSFNAPELVPRERGRLDLSEVHRARVTLRLRGETLRWVAPFEALSEPGAPAVRGRLTGFVDEGPTLALQARPVRDFRGWLWQGARCADPAADPANCARRAFFSIRLPVEAYRQALFAKPRPVWPPADLDQTLVHVQMLGPGSEQPLFDSDGPGASPPPALAELAQALLPGEALHIRKMGGTPQEVVTLRGEDDTAEPSLPWLSRLISILPVPTVATPALTGRETIATVAGDYALTLSGNVRSIERALSVVATRMSWYVGAMLTAIALGWLVIEIGLIRRVTALTRRAAAVSYNVNAPQVEQRIGALDVSDLRGKDELGILAGALADLLERVKGDLQREHIRAQQERDMWHAVGHEIMSPLQSLMVLHPDSADTSHRYVQRMQQAVKVLYGQASPSEALQAAALQLNPVDLDAFLCNVAANAHFAGVHHVHYAGGGAPMLARADEFSLEDVVTHILRNADRHRTGGTPITLSLQRSDSTATVTLHNQGPQIDPALLGRIFEYGVSGGEPRSATADPGQRGQGLFVAKTYMAKMGGTIEARNVEGGVSFELTLQRAV